VKAINWCSDAWIVVTLAIMFISIALDVLTREVFNSPLTWHLEVSQYMLINVTYVGAAVAHRHSQHISINSLVARLPKISQICMDLFGKVLLLPFLLLLVYSACTLLFETRGLTPVLRLPMWTYYSPVFVGSVLLCLYSILACIKDVRAIAARRAAMGGPVPGCGA
jgi:TRAP-type C4-dicarboxylate transport system permease small subunit